MRPVIVGLDPGITAGFAVIDLEGNVLFVGSGKHLSFHEIINATIKHGKPIIIGTDKFVVPNMVDKYARNTGAKIISPKGDDLKSEDKRLILNGNLQRNSHENDALACALFALKELKPLFQKVDYFLEKEKKAELSESIKTLLVLRYDMTIKKAFDFLTKPKEEKVKVEKPKAVQTQTLLTDKEADLTQKIESLDKQIFILKRQNQTLKNIANRDKNDYNNMIRSLMKKSTDQRVSMLIDSKEKTISSQAREIEKAKTESKNKQDEIQRLVNVIKILSRGKHYFLPKLKNLSIDEISQKIDQDEERIIAFVESPSNFSETALVSIKNKILCLVHKDTVPRSLNERFVFISQEKLALEDFGAFFLCKKEELDKQINKSNVLSNVLTDYKSSRESELR